MAGYLRGCGIQPGDRVSILEDNSHAFLEAYFASAGIAAILNPLNTRLHPRELAAILVDAGSKWLLANPRFAHQVEETLASVPGVHGVLSAGLAVLVARRVLRGIERDIDRRDAEPPSTTKLEYLPG